MTIIQKSIVALTASLALASACAVQTDKDSLPDNGENVSPSNDWHCATIEDGTGGNLL